MRCAGVVMLLVGHVLTFGSCAAFPSQVGSDYAAVNGGAIMGAMIGLPLALAGAAFLIGGDRRE